MKAALTGKTIHYRFKEVVWPKLREKGYAIILGPFGWNVHIAKPAVAKNLFRNSNQFLKPVISNPGSLTELFLGEVNIVGSNGEQWKRLRRPANPIFGQSFQPEAFSPCVLETLDALDERVNRLQGQPIEVKDLMELMTLDVLGKGIFSHDFEAVKSLGNSNYHKLYKGIMSFLFNPFFVIVRPLAKLSFGPPERARKNINEFNSFILGLINQRRKDLKNGKFLDSKDLLSTMLRDDPDSPYEPLTDEELVHNFNIFFLAGHDTTANTLSYALYHLARNRDVQDKLRNEIYQKMNLDDNQEKLVVPTSEQLKNMEYLNLVIKETMRVSPAVQQIGRKLAEDYTIPEDNIVLPKGTSVTLSIFSILNDPKIYPNPEKFDPERFLNTKYDIDTYMPFGGGSRMCVGMNFSLMEQKIFLSLLLQKFDLRITKDNPDYEQLRVSGLGLTRPMDLKLNFEARL
ncbi:cytochrome P450 [Conidiobolus coronatus NRRL 28638]|uniref:Cytochrome P450 n=1 Tax=Conidiobolus coronatus (strain ATCC 28846 / CBS 209.66 / NRRL 28638) TaxID=796925 RepID=A0A137PIV5_CONC2|nr:cytochrome P450 [Conidiobolus coronatus NRRL 28638]|eukprot:KXN74938.1 cytochrome P450 [Conidiobolus coronatus NRRL 28638]